jgi:dGTP triphosphohydrolase
MGPDNRDAWEQERRSTAGSPRLGIERDDFERDRARIIHTAAFRRLQGKTQIFGVGEHDFYRTRLTHSMEAAQIGQGIVYTLRKKETSDIKPTFKGVWPTEANFALLPFRDTRHGQSPRPHK